MLVFSADHSVTGGTVEGKRSVHEMDRRSLLAFHEAAQGASWPTRMRWNLDGNPRSWYGVRFDKEGRVVQLRLVFTEEEGEDTLFKSILSIDLFGEYQGTIAGSCYMDTSRMD